MSLSDSVKKIGFRKAYEYLDKDPDANIPKLMDWVDKFAGAPPIRSVILQHSSRPRSIDKGNAVSRCWTRPPAVSNFAESHSPVTFFRSSRSRIVSTPPSEMVRRSSKCSSALPGIPRSIHPNTRLSSVIVINSATKSVCSRVTR